MKPKYSPKESRKIALHIAQMDAQKKSRSEMLTYLKSKGFTNPYDKLNQIREAGDYVIDVERARLILEQIAKKGAIDTEEVKNVQKPETVERDGVVYEKAEPVQEFVPELKVEVHVEVAGKYATYKVEEDGSVVAIPTPMMNKFGSLKIAREYSVELAAALDKIEEVQKKWMS